MKFQSFIRIPIMVHVDTEGKDHPLFTLLSVKIDGIHNPDSQIDLLPILTHSEIQKLRAEAANHLADRDQDALMKDYDRGEAKAAPGDEL